VQRLTGRLARRWPAVRPAEVPAPPASLDAPVPAP
jgi:hypothetical protein